MDYDALRKRITEVHSDAGSQPSIIDQYNTIRNFTNALLKECWGMENKQQFNFILENQKMKHLILKWMAEQGAAFEKAYFSLGSHPEGYKGDGDSWGKSAHFNDLVACGLITGHNRYVKLTPLGVEYCKAQGFYISTRFELMMPKLLAMVESRDARITELKNQLQLIEHDNWHISKLIKEMMAVDGKDVP